MADRFEPVQIKNGEWCNIRLEAGDRAAVHIIKLGALETFVISREALIPLIEALDRIEEATRDLEEPCDIHL